MGIFDFFIIKFLKKKDQHCVFYYCKKTVITVDNLSAKLAYLLETKIKD